MHLVRDVWTPESGLLTAAMKLKRKSLETAFSAEIGELYSCVGSKTPTNNNYLPSKTGNVTSV